MTTIMTFRFTMIISYEKGARVISLYEDGRMTTEIIKIGKGFIPKDNG